MTISWETCDPWVTPTEIVTLTGDDQFLVSGEHEELGLTAAQWASTLLWNLSGRMEGLCTWEWWPDYHWPCPRHVIFLDTDGRPAYAIDEVVAVTLEPDATRISETLDPSAYQLLNRNRLHRVDGEEWPEPFMREGELYGIKVTAQIGTPVSTPAKVAASVLAMEYAKKVMNRPCQFPSRLRMVSVQGADYPVLDSMDFIRKRRTGIYEVDLWLASNDHSLDAAAFDPAVQPSLFEG